MQNIVGTEPLVLQVRKQGKHLQTSELDSRLKNKVVISEISCQQEKQILQSKDLWPEQGKLIYPNGKKQPNKTPSMFLFGFTLNALGRSNFSAENALPNKSSKKQ